MSRPVYSVNGLILSPEEDCLCEKEKSLDDVSSEGLRQWNMDMDIEYQYEQKLMREKHTRFFSHNSNL